MVQYATIMCRRHTSVKFVFIFLFYFSSGVSAKLREKLPYIIAIHCCNHRLALCAEGAAKEVGFLFHTFEPWLISHWAYFHFSPTRWQRLQAFYSRHRAALPDPAALGPLMVPQKAGHTRWMSMIKAIIPLISSLEVLLSFYLFEEPQHDAKAAGIGKIMNTFAFLRTLFMYADVIAIVNECAISLQSSQLDFSAAILLVKHCRDRLQALRNDPSSGHWLSVQILAVISYFQTEMAVKPHQETLCQGNGY